MGEGPTVGRGMSEGGCCDNLWNVGSVDCEESKTSWREKPIQVKQAVTWARDTAFDLRQIMHRADDVPLESISVRWKPPDNDWMKCNVDGAYYPSDGSGETGIVLRDQRGGFVGARAKWQKHSLNALSMEVNAAKEGMEFALDRGIRKLVVATNCKELVKLWDLGAAIGDFANL